MGADGKLGCTAEAMRPDETIFFWVEEETPLTVCWDGSEQKEERNWEGY
jgi:hypothetical protein